MNENNNRVNAAITAGNFTSLTSALADLDADLNASTVGLTDDERQALPKINVANRAFVQDALNLMATPTAGTFMPAYLQTAAAQVDLALFDQMDQLHALLQPMLQKVIDTRILAGSEAYTTALTFYKLAQAASAAGIPGTQAISDALRERFAGQGGSGNSGGSGDDGGSN